MSRLATFSSRWLSNLTLQKGQLYVGLLDNKIILATAEQVFFDQAANFLFHQTEQKIVAFGDQAISWQTNLVTNHSNLKIVNVLDKGAITDLELAEVFFKQLLTTYLAKIHYRHFKLTFFHQSFLSPLQKQHLTDLFKKLGFFKIKSIALGELCAKQAHDQAFWTLFLGKDLAEFSLIGQADLLASYKLSFRLSALNTSLQHFFQDNLGLKVTYQEIDRVLAKLNFTASQSLLLQIKGEDQQHQFVVKSIQSALVCEQVGKIFDSLLSQLRLYLSLAEMLGLNAPINSAKQPCLLLGPILKKWPFIHQVLEQNLALAFKPMAYPDFLLAQFNYV